jgi:hypothetical protein
MHQNASMRTTIDLPENLYRTLKVRAGMSGLTLRELVQQLIEKGLSSPRGAMASPIRHAPPPVIIPYRGMPIPAVSRAEIARMDEEEDEAKYAGLS